MNKKKSNKRVEIVFTNGTIRFVTRYEGDITYLLDTLDFKSRGSSYNYMTVYKVAETLDFSYTTENTYDYGNFISMQYRFDDGSEYMNLDRFKSLVEPYNFVVENMYVIKQKKKEKKK